MRQNVGEGINELLDSQYILYRLSNSSSIVQGDIAINALCTESSMCCITPTDLLAL